MYGPKVKYMFEYDWIEGGIRGGGEYSGTVERDTYDEIIKEYTTMLMDEEHSPYNLCLCVEIDINENDLI